MQEAVESSGAGLDQTDDGAHDNGGSRKQERNRNRYVKTRTKTKTRRREKGTSRHDQSRRRHPFFSSSMYCPIARMSSPARRR